jgi:hypothetical protein
MFVKDTKMSEIPEKVTGSFMLLDSSNIKSFNVYRET